MAFDYKFPVPPTDPTCQSSFVRGFAHNDWVDGQDTVQAEQTADEEGLNARLHRIERDLDALGANLATAFACIQILRGQLVQALTDIKGQFNAKPPKEGKDSKEFKDVKDTKDAKDSKDTKDTKDAKDTKDTKDAKDSKDTKDTKDGKDSKDHKDGKEGKDAKEKEGKEGLGAIEKQLDGLDAPFALPVSSLASFLWAEQPVADGPMFGRAFIQPDERPLVGRRVIEESTQPEEP
jgi:hypothetical protein